MYGRNFTRFFFLLLPGLVIGLSRSRAQSPALNPAAPAQSGIASPPLPPTLAPARPVAAPRPLAHPRFLHIDAETADRPVLRRIKVKNTVPDSLSALREVRELVLALQADSYLTASADEMRWRRDTVRVRLYVGEKFRWARLRNGNLGDALLTRAGYRERFFRNQPWVPADWAKLQERVLTEAENQGFPFATVGLDSVQLSGHDIAGRVVLKRGPLIVFDSLEILGTTKTKKRFLTKYLQLTPGQPFSQQRVVAAAQLLRQLPYVRLKAEPEVRFSRGRARVYLLLDERPSNQFDAIIGVIPNTGSSGVTFTGDVNVTLRNIKGGGKGAGLQFRKTDASSQLLDAQYLHPSFFGTPLELSATFNLYRQNLAFSTIKPRVEVAYPTARAGRVSFFFEQRSSRLLDTDSSLATLPTLPENIDSRYNSYGLAYNWNSLDDLYFPHRGYLITGQGAVGTKVIIQNSAIPVDLYEGVQMRTTQYTFGLRAERYAPVGRNGVLLLRGRGESLVNERLFKNDLFRVGGLNSLRGFAENQFYASTYAIATAEFRQFTGADSYVFLFVDQAYLQQKTLTDGYDDLPTGVGAGLSFRTPAGLFQFVYSVGRSAEANQSFALGNSKVHFGLTSRF